MTPSSDQASLVSLKQWMSKAYVRSGMIQLLVVEFLLLLILLGAFFLLNQNHTAETRKEREQVMIQALQARTDWISSQLVSVQSALQLLQRQASRQVQPYAQQDESSALVLSEQNVLHKPYDDDGVSVYYSAQSSQLTNRQPLARQWLPLSPVMVDLKRSHHLIRQIYLNTPDSLNLLYPFVDVTEQFAPDLDVTSFSFYYLAGAQHNPKRESVWTDAYLDPAGQGWVISHISPIYKDDDLEAVIGIDLTIQSLINELFATPQQWPGYGILIGKNGNILALPPEGEEDFGLKELTQHQYSFQQVKGNQFKPSQFNLYKRSDLKELSRLVAHQQAGLAQINLAEPSVVAWNTVPSTGWKLLAVTKEKDLYIRAAHFSGQLEDMALLVLFLVLIVFLTYAVFQSSRTRRLSRQMMGPLDYFQEVIHRSGQIDTSKPLNSPVLEIHQTAELIQELVQKNNELCADIEHYHTVHQQKNTYFRNLLNNIPLPVFNTDKEFRIRGCSRAFESFFGRTEAELQGHLMTEFIPLNPPEKGIVKRDLTLTNSAGQSRHMTVLLTRQTEVDKSGAGGTVLIGLLIDFSEQHHEHDQIRFDRDRALEASQLQSEYLQAIRREIEGPLIELRKLVHQMAQQPESGGHLQLQLYDKIDALMFLAKDNGLARTSSESKAPPPPVKDDCHVLVVDDGPVNTMLARSVLQKVGYDVDVAFSGTEALEMMDRKSYQVVLMDIFMPDMDGIETTKRWRDQEKTLQRPAAAIIALTANVIESEREHFFAAGMNEYLAKPYHPSELRERVDYWRQQYETGPIEV